MSRSDGKFPKVHKVTLTNADVPEDWSVSRRCVSCNKHWPDHAAFAPTPCCDSAIVRQQVPPDMSWQDAVFVLKEKAFDRAYDEWNEGFSDEQLLWEDVTTDGALDDAKINDALEEFIDDALKERSR
jgi:hypothetical protein